MLILNVKALLQQQGHVYPQRHLVSHGFTQHTASRLLNNVTKTISYADLEKLCMLCRCTPDDLFVWEPGAGMENTEKNPLHKLRPKPNPHNPVESIKRLPLKKLQALQEFIEKLEKE